eukprot:6661031-Alexandrium_andersonii.AAC.1
MPCSPRSSDSFTQVVNSESFSEFLQETGRMGAEQMAMMEVLPKMSQDTEAAEEAEPAPAPPAEEESEEEEEPEQTGGRCRGAA